MAVISQVSCKLTNSLFIYSERLGISMSSLDIFDGPEEFLQDPHFWIDMGLCEKGFARAAKIVGDPNLGATIGSHIVELGAFGALDHVFKIMPSARDYYSNLPRFFSYFLAPLGELIEISHSDKDVRFLMPIIGEEFPHILGYLKSTLESLPRYTGHSPSHTEWDSGKNELYINWDSTQPSLFTEEPHQVLNPKLVQNLSGQLEAAERALQGKQREVLAQRAEIEQLRKSAQTQVRDKIYAEKMAGLAQLAAGVAHEINNPLSYVMSNLGRFEDYFNKLRTYVISLERGYKSAELKKNFDIEFIFSESPLMLQEASEGLRRVKEIVKDLSSLAHPQSDRDENKMLTDINGILDSSLKVFQDDLTHNGIRVEKSFGLQKTIQVFPVRLSQVFMNLLSNAIHAISQQGVIEVKTSEEEGQAVIEIADNGEGMDEAVLAQIFTPFFTTKDVGKGTGLGLSIAQSIVEMHKGHIDVKSVKGKGSRFIVTLPIQENSYGQNF